MIECVTQRCFLCGSMRLASRKYLRRDSLSWTRNVAYSLPAIVARVASVASARFAASYQPVHVNKQYFDRTAVFCLDCCTGRAVPNFTDVQLSNYYHDFYWRNRDVVDGQHVSEAVRPNSGQLTLTSDRLSWIAKQVAKVGSAIDFGAGDCAAAYELLRHGTIVHVVDPSVRARDLSSRYGATYSDGLASAPVVDLVYSAHSIEHVPDFTNTIAAMLDRTKVGGHLFFETPNIGDEAVFMGLVHTPHTYMLSESSFRILEATLPIRIISLEACGPEWGLSHPAIKSAALADLRVLLQKTDELRPKDFA